MDMQATILAVALAKKNGGGGTPGVSPTITVSGILKGDGSGGITAAEPGRDYGTYSKPEDGIPDSDIASAESWNALENKFNVYIGDAEKVVSVSRATAGLNTESISDLAIPTKIGYTFYMWLCTSGTATIPMMSCAPVANPTLLYYVASTAGSNANIQIRPVFIKNEE